MSRLRRISWPYMRQRVPWSSHTSTYLLGASMRMGAEIPRYNLEALPDVNPASKSYVSNQAYPSCLMIFLKQSTMPLYASSPVALLVCSCLGTFRWLSRYSSCAVAHTRVLTTSSGYLWRVSSCLDERSRNWAHTWPESTRTHCLLALPERHELGSAGEHTHFWHTGHSTYTWLVAGQVLYSFNYIIVTLGKCGKVLSCGALLILASYQKVAATRRIELCRVSAIETYRPWTGRRTAGVSRRLETFWR